MKYSTLLYGSIIIMNISMLMGYKISGNLAISNLGQVLSLSILLPVVLKYLDLKQYIYIISLIISIFASSMLFNLFTLTPIKIEFLIFFSISIFTLISIFTIVKRDKRSVKYIISAFKSSSVITLIYFSIYAIYDIVIKGSPFSAFGFDDKSHAVLVCIFYSFVILIIFKTKIKYLFSIIFVILSFLTISRLSLLFMPFYIISFITNYLKEPKAKGKAIYIQQYFSFVFLFITIISTIIFISKNADSFKLLERLDNNLLSGASTNAHFLLIEYGIKLKFDSIINFIFGVSPGNFATALSVSTVDYSEISFIDPPAFLAINQGFAPMHSTHATVFTEFPIIIFVIYILFLVWLFKSLIKNKVISGLLFYIPFIAAITFYSSLNELFFYSILIFLISISQKKEKEYLV